MTRGRGARYLSISILLSASLFAACGSGPSVPVKLARVPDGLVPTTVATNNLAFYENTSAEVRKAFANTGKKSLAADGRLWELRRGDRLVGALQIATLVPDVDLEDAGRRNEILRQIMPATVDEVTIGEVNVWSSTSRDKKVYLWFARDLFAVLSLKGTEEDLDAEGVVNEVVGFAAAADTWNPLYIEDEDDEDRDSAD